MDAPSWHPANQNANAAQRDVAPPRTTYVIVDTSTEEERQMVAASEENVVLGGGRGLLDPSDRLYLVEQTQLKLQAQSMEELERQNALRTFRMNALKVQAHKTETTVPLTGSGKLPLLPAKKDAVIVIRAKKRKLIEKETETELKKSPRKWDNSGGKNGQMPAHLSTIETLKNDQKPVVAVMIQHTQKAPLATRLLEDYSSSSDEETEIIRNKVR